MLRRLRVPRWAALALVGAFALLAAGAALATDGGDVVEECYEQAGGVPQAGIRACRAAQGFVFQTGRACRMATTPENCEMVDGRFVSANEVNAYVGSWVPRTLALQRDLDDEVALKRELWVHTHNSFNAEAYLPTLSGLDPNQIYSITDQMRMGVRAIEIDVHWFPSPEGRPEDGGMAPIVCHGETVHQNPASVHVGCTVEVHIETRLQEVKTWLDANPNEVLMIYLQNELDGVPLAHERTIASIDEIFEDLVYQPPPRESGCVDLPIDNSRSDTRADGRVILVGNCGPSTWPSRVFQRGDRWEESSHPAGDTYPEYPCTAERSGFSYDEHWNRYYEDSTAVGVWSSGSPREIPGAEAAKMARCEVNMPGFDQLQPFDPKLEGLVWSWAENEPLTSADGDCAYAGADGRFRTDGCVVKRTYSCVYADGTWATAGPAGKWKNGPRRCSKIGATFSVPTSGYRNELLKEAKGPAEVWLDYKFVAAQNRWAPEASGD